VASEVEPYTVPALVLGEPARTTLSTIRALARARIPQFAVGAGSSFVAYSRWHRRLPTPAGRVPTPGTLAEWLEPLPFRRMVLIPCSDRWVEAAAALPPNLIARFPASIAPRDSIAACLDKGRFAAMLERLGVPHPHTIQLRPGDDVWALSRGLREPFVKPRDSVAFRERYRTKVFRFGTADVLATFVRDAQVAGLDLMLQEFIPGPPSSHYLVEGFVDRTGSVCARFARRRLRMLPEPFGDSTCAVSVRLDEVKEPVAILDRVLAAVEYRGIFNAEFKYDTGEGAFKLIEINPRPWGGMGLSLECGVNVVEMAYRDALDMRVEPIGSYTVNRSRLDDPLPGLMDFRYLAGLALRKRVSRNAGASGEPR
jgi:predicted ATP-grasp superfamily ATP-dependent carboligase